MLVSFNELADKNPQDFHIERLITIPKIQRKIANSEDVVARSETYTYKIRKGDTQIRICKQTFTSLYGVTTSRIEWIADHLSKNMSILHECRGSHKIVKMQFLNISRNE